MPGKEPLVTRYEKNPILTKEDVPYPVATVHNAGIIKHSDRYIMLFRSHLAQRPFCNRQGRQR